jgi:hypothetical protein
VELPFGFEHAGGGPHFLSARDCSPPATHDGNMELVLGNYVARRTAS